MPCFCTGPADNMTNQFSPRFVPVLPSTPLSLRLAAALPTLGPETRVDMALDLRMENIRLPNMTMFGGNMGMLNIAQSLSLMAGSFKIDSLPQLEFDMQQAAESFNHNIWPRLNFLPKFKMQSLINFAIIARLVLDLRALEIDPFDIDFFPTGERFHPGYHDYPYKLSPPKLQMARFLAGLPNLLTMSETLDLPPLGDPGALDVLHNRMHGLAHLTPPKLIVPLPMIPKMAMVLESLATIQEAFGDDCFSPSTLGRIDRMIQTWNTFPIPIPWPALALKAKLDVLPKLEDVRLGEEMAGTSYNYLKPLMQMSPPKLAVAPMINAMIALNASMKMMIDMPAFDMCSMCNCA